LIALFLCLFCISVVVVDDDESFTRDGENDHNKNEIVCAMLMLLIARLSVLDEG